METRELDEARLAVADRQFSSALSYLRVAERVAVAQRKLPELLEVRELARQLTALSAGQTKTAGAQLERRVETELRAFPGEELAAAGIEPEREVAALVSKLRVLAGPPAAATTRDLSRARTAIDQGEFATALSHLQEARRVAVAQRRLDELLEVHRLLQLLATRGGERARVDSERLAQRTEDDLRAFADDAGISRSPH
jgi:hypothetical protein